MTETLSETTIWLNLILVSLSVSVMPDPDGMTETLSETRIKLSQIVASGCKKFTYTYDFGDNWEHVIAIEKTLDAESGVRYPRCITGKRACPPEDCGGAWGYGEFLEKIQDPKDAEDQEALDWLGGELDSEADDEEGVH